MTTLNFQPLQHMRDLEDCDCKHPKTCEKCRLKKPGVYIWGFLYENEGDSEKTESKLCNDHRDKKHDWKILKCDDTKIDKVYEAIKSVKQEPCSDYLFIPYYVGMSEADVFGRLRDHKDLEKGDSTKYVRLHEDYMLCYHKHILTLNSAGNSNSCLPLFPIKRASVNNNFVWSLLAKDGYVHYFNRRSTNFINKNNTPSAKSAFDHIKENENYSIAQCDKDFTNEIQKEDPLNKRIIDNNNFWFAYCELELKNESLFEYLKSKKEDLVSRISKTPDIDKKEEKKMNSKYKNEINRLDSKIKKAKSDIKNNNKYLCHQAEAATYFTLRGITFSRTHTVEFPEGWEIQNKSGFNIFLDNGTEKTLGKDNIRTCTPKDEFNWPGYW